MRTVIAFSDLFQMLCVRSLTLLSSTRFALIEFDNVDTKEMVFLFIKNKRGDIELHHFLAPFVKSQDAFSLYYLQISPNAIIQNCHNQQQRCSSYCFMPRTDRIVSGVSAIFRLRLNELCCGLDGEGNSNLRSALRR